MVEKRTVITPLAQVLRPEIGYDCRLCDFLTTIEDAIARVPTDQRENVYVDWIGDEGDDLGCLSFTHCREETDEEAAAREQKEARQREAELHVQEYNERVTYERLKAKYEGTK